MKKIELLAPAGSKDALIGAINAGANAVYVGGKKFGARAFADNLSIDELIYFIEFAHEHNAMLYVTINTVIYSDEVSSLFIYTDILVKNNVDAFIVQDIGLMEYLIKRYPDTAIHASTQVNTLTVNQAKYLKSIGVKRIILARETSIETVKTIKASVDIELEVFGHGALCVSYSGNCYLSSVNGDRSGNRGECAQPCRLAYTMTKDNEILKEKTYLLSTKDLMTLPEMDRIIASQVDSIKIEGRMRKSDYVVTTILAYRKAIDDVYRQTKTIGIDLEIQQLKKVFNREFTKGYLLDEKPTNLTQDTRPNHIGVEIGKVLSYRYGKTVIQLSDSLHKGDGIRVIGKVDVGDQVSKIVKNGQIVDEAYQGDIITIDLPKAVEEGNSVNKTMDMLLSESTIPYLDETMKMIPLHVKVIAKLDCPLIVSFSDGVNESMIESDYLIEKALNQAISSDKVMKQIDKLGGTPYFIQEVICEVDEDIFIPNMILNETRRLALESIIQKRRIRPSQRIVEPEKHQLVKIPMGPIELVVKVETRDQFDAVMNSSIKKIMVPWDWDVSVTNASEKEIIRTLPRIKPNSFQYPHNTAVLIQDIGDFEETMNVDVYSDAYMNITNHYSLESMLMRKVKTITCSIEMGLAEIQSMQKEFVSKHSFYPPLMVLSYGRIDTMISKYCPIAKAEGMKSSHCHLCEKHDYAVIDPTGATYLLKNDGDCNIRILHHRVLNLIEFLPEFQKNQISYARLDFTVESKALTAQVIEAFQNKLQNKYYQMPEMKYTHLKFRY